MKRSSMSHRHWLALSLVALAGCTSNEKAKDAVPVAAPMKEPPAVAAAASHDELVKRGAALVP